MKLVFVPLKDVFKECKGKRQFSIKKDAYRRFSSVSNEMQIGIKKIAALYQIGNFGRPAHVWFVSQLPKTRSGKMLRRTIQAICEGRDPGDLTTIDDPASLDQIRQAMEE